MLKSIKIQNFKAIKELTLNNLVSVNYLVGKNGSGKSSVLQCLEMWSSMRSNRKYLSLNHTIYNRDSEGSEIAIFPDFRDASIINEEDYYSLLGDFDESRPNQDFEYEMHCFNRFYRIENIDKYSWLRTKSHSQKILDFSFTVANNKTYKYSFSANHQYISADDMAILHFGLDEDDIFDYSSIFYHYRYNQDKLELTKKLGNENNLMLIQLLEELYKEFNLKVFRVERDGVIEGLEHLKFLQISGGNIYLINLLTSILSSQQDVILIEEIETRLHPDWCKKIPFILNKLAEKVGKQFIISTHSPFIISAAASLPDQKVYYIDNGTCTNPNGESGYGAKKQANELLGIGFEDYHHKIVICEGSPSKEFPGLDAEVYNAIFWDKEYLFVSAGGETQLVSNSELAKKVIKNIFKDSGAISFYLKDGDGKSSKAKVDESSKNQINFGSPLKFTNRYSLECYLFDPEVIKIKFPDKTNYQGIFDEWKKQCWNNGKYDHGKVPRLALVEQANAEKLHLELAKLINPTDTPIVYQELYNCIFGEL